MKTKTIILLSFLAAACGEVTSGDGGDAPTISAVSPDRGGLPGGAQVTITGTGFADGVDAELGNRVIVGGLEATDVDTVDDATLTFTLPPGPSEGATVDVIVFNSNGFAVANDALTYNPLPLVTSLSTNFGGQSGGGTVTITGRGFQELAAGDTTVSFGAATTTEVTVESDTVLTATIPPHADADPFFQRLDVTVSNANGSATVPAAFTYGKPGLLAAGAPNRSPGLFWIDANTFESVRISQNARLLALSNIDDTIYAVTQQGQRSLVTVNPATGETTLIGPFVESNTLNGGTPTGSFVKVGDTVFAYDRSSQRVVTVDLTTGQFTFLSAAPIAVSRTLHLAPRDESSLFGFDQMNQAIRILSTADGTASNGPTMTFPDTSFDTLHGGLLIGDTLHVIAHQRNQTGTLASVDTVTGELTEVKSGVVNAGSITTTPSSFE